MVATDGFEILWEVEPATRPDIMHVRHQIGVMSRTAAAFLIPDNHLGRATVSSIAVAHEVALMGGRSIACLNARDRNVLGFRRDLLTAAAYGVDEFLFVYGDRPETGARSDDLSVASMITEARRFAGENRRSRWSIPTGRHFGVAALAELEDAMQTFFSARSRSPSTTSWSGARRSRSTDPCTQGSWWWPVRRWRGSFQTRSPSFQSPTLSSVASNETETPEWRSPAT